MNLRTAAMPANLLRLGAGALGLAAVGILLVQGSEAAFTGSTENKGNSVAAGTVTVTDNDAQSAMFSINDLNHGETLQRCITVTYTGSLEADVKLHANVQSSTTPSLAPGLLTTVKVGTTTPSTPDSSPFSCEGFQADPAVESFNGTLAGFGDAHESYATGFGGFNDAVAGNKKTYQISMTITSDETKNTYQGKNATVGFTWEATGDVNDTRVAENN